MHAITGIPAKWTRATRWAGRARKLVVLAIAAGAIACDRGVTVGQNVGPDGAAADGAGDGAGEPGEDGGAGDGGGGGDGGEGLRPGELALVAASVSFTADRVCDLDGDGLEDNAFAELGGSEATVATMLWSSLGDAALGNGYGPGLFFADLEEGGESTLIALSGDGTALEGVLRAPYESMDYCGEPIFHYQGELVAGGQLSLTAESHPVLLGDAVTAGAAHVTGVVTEGAEGITIETEECLTLTTASLGAAPGPTQTRQMSLLETVLAGGSVLGMAGAQGLSPDLDLDGDGLERLLLDADGRIVQCVDGDDTVIEGRDCWDDERMADGFALTRRVTYEETTFGGRFVGWMSYCAEGYVDPSLFGRRWNATEQGQLSIGRSHACLREGDGAIRCWGSGAKGQLGYGHTVTVGDDEPACAAGSVDVGEGTLGVTASGNLTCAILPERRLKCWGNLGDDRPNIGDDETPAEAPVFELGAPVQQIVAGHSHLCALLSGGRVRCWLLAPEARFMDRGVHCDDYSPEELSGGGLGGIFGIIFGLINILTNLQVGGAAPADCGALGYGSTDTVSLDEALLAPDVPIGGRALSLAAGLAHVCALLEGGTVRCWGRGGEGALGYGNTENVGDDETPEHAGDVDLGAPAIAITAGDYYTCALLEGGAVRCWGRGNDGVLGYGNTESVGDDETPESAGDVDLGGPAIAIAAGNYHTCALLEGGTVRCWGVGGRGALGYGNSGNVGDDETPREAGDVPVGASVVDLAVGGNTTCAILDDGAVRCWGSTALGYGNTENVGDDETPESAGEVPLDCAPAICGDGRREVAEVCDDGNAAGSDGCDMICTVENGFVCDGASPSACHEVICGDGAVEGDEECDDGNVTADDGCSPGCVRDRGWVCTVPALGGASECQEYCLGGYPTLTPGVSSYGDTTGAPALMEGSCGGSGPEVLYTLEVPALSDVVIRTDFVATEVNTYVYAQSACADLETELGCDSVGGALPFTSRLELTSVPAGTYYVFVDTFSPAEEGTFEVLATVTPL